MDASGLFFLAVLGWALGWMLVFPALKMGAALLCAVCGMLFTAFYGVIAFSWMSATAYGLIVGGLGMLLIGIGFALADRRGLRRRLRGVALPGYLLIALLGVLTTRNMCICDHDSLSYWLRIVRELYLFQRFPIHGDSNMFHSDYIPMLASLQYCVVQVFGWRDASLVYVMYAVIAASLTAVAQEIKGRGWSALLLLLTFYGFAVFGFRYQNLRADGPMSILFTAGALCLFAREDDAPASFLPAFCACAVLTGFKIYSGLLLALALGLAMLSVLPGARRRGVKARPLLWMCLGALACAAAMQLCWSGLYHYHTAMARYEAAVAAAPYTGVTATVQAPTFTLASLFSGNPRTASLLSSFSGETFRAVGDLIADTFAAYGGSLLPWVWLFVLPPLLAAALGSKEERKRVISTFVVLLLTGTVYLLGLFGSYFVQAETAPAAITYLTTVTLPFLIAGLFWSVEFASRRGRPGGLCRWALPLAAAGMLLLCPPSVYGEGFANETQPQSYAALADSFYQDELEGLLTPEDAGKHALLIDCSYEAAEIKSESGKTHAYQYYALPVRVEVLQYPVADYSLLDGVTRESLLGVLNACRCDLLILRVEDEVYWESLRDALALDGEDDEGVGVYDVEREAGEIRFTMRTAEEL